MDGYGIRQRERGGTDRLTDNVEGGDYTIDWTVRREGYEGMTTEWRLKDENGVLYDLLDVRLSASRRWWEITARRSAAQGITVGT